MSAVAAGHSEPQSEITDATAGCAAALEGHEVPTRFLWKHCTSKTRVELIGSWDSWAARLPMAWSFVHGAALLWLPLRPGTHEFKFIVDGDKWSYDIDFPTVLSGVGSRNNVVVVKPKYVFRCFLVLLNKKKTCLALVELQFM